MNIRIEDQDGKRTYYVNDVPYSRIEDIPEEHRHHFADSNNNGMPDQFDSLFKLAGDKVSVKDVFKTLASEIKSSVQGEEPAVTSEKGRTQRNEPKSSGGFPLYIKILIFILIGISAALFIVSRLPDNTDTPVSDSPSDEAPPVEETQPEVTPETQAVEPEADSNEFRFVMEDPNEPPYHMFANVFQGNTLLFAFDLPDGAMMDTGAERLAIELEIPQGTNLSSAVFDATILTDQCLADDVDWATKKVGATEYKTGLLSDSGAGHSYNTYYYVINGKYCAQFTLTLTSVNAGISDTNLKEYNPDNLVSLVEDVLKTIRFE